MTKPEFLTSFSKLQEAYDTLLTEGEIESYFAELGGYDARDLARAVQRIPANEPRTAYKPFPGAAAIRNYILDAQESRRIQEQRQQPQGLEDVLARSQKHKHTPEQLAWGKLCCTLSLLSLDRAPINKRVRLIEDFIDNNAPWLAMRCEEREWLQDKLTELGRNTAA